MSFINYLKKHIYEFDREAVAENLRKLPHAPSVQFQRIFLHFFMLFYNITYKYLMIPALGEQREQPLTDDSRLIDASDSDQRLPRIYLFI